jgi:hypothetical protein
MRHLRRLAIVSLVLAATTALTFACSSFSEAPTPAGGDGGEEGGLEGAAPDGRPATPCEESKLATDGQHCGRCGHSCLGGACAAGVCQPVLVATTAGEGVVEVAVDDQRILWMTSSGPWSNRGHVYGCLKSGCGGVPTSMAAATAQTGSLVGDGKVAFASFVFGSRGVSRVAADGTLQRVEPLGTYGAAVRLQLIGNDLTFISLYEPGSTIDGGRAATVYRWDGLTATKLGGYVDKLENLDGFAAVGKHLVFSSYGKLYACESGSCPALAEIVGNTHGRTSTTTDGQQYIWVAIETKEVLGCDPSTSCVSPTVLLGPSSLGASGAALVSYAAGKLYIATSGGDLLECDPTKCPSTLRRVARETDFVFGNYAFYGHTVTADSEAVYWAALDDGDAAGPVTRIMKLAK